MSAATPINFQERKLERLWADDGARLRCLIASVEYLLHVLDQGEAVDQQLARDLLQAYNAEIDSLEVRLRQVG